MYCCCCAVRLPPTIAPPFTDPAPLPASVAVKPEPFAACRKNSASRYSRLSAKVRMSASETGVGAGAVVTTPLLLQPARAAAPPSAPAPARKFRLLTRFLRSSVRDSIGSTVGPSGLVMRGKTYCTSMEHVAEPHLDWVRLKKNKTKAMRIDAIKNEPEVLL